MKIKLEGLRCHAHHGVLPQETAIGGDFEVSVTLHLPDSAVAGAVLRDDLAHTVNYAEVHALVRQQMAQPSQLLEHVAGRLARALLEQFVRVRQVDVQVRKVCPPISGWDGRGCTVDYSLRRRLIVWDFDGTLADTAAGIVATMLATFQEEGWTPPTEADVRRTIGLPLDASIAQLLALTNPTVPTQRALAGVRTYRRLFETIGAPGTQLYAGIREVLQAQQELGATLAIATSRGHASVVQLMEQLGIAHYFSEVVAMEDVQQHKPHPAPVRQLLKATHTAAADTVVIGDTTFDVLMACRAGARAIGVAWGNHSEEQLREAGATFVALEVDDLLPAAGYVAY